VVLFDEIEKAHPDIFNSLLQVLEEGRLTDGQGRVVDFKNTVIIMTTNLGTKDITGGPVGFTLEGNEEASYQSMKAKVVEELKKNFKPEFLNRVDETIVFPQLNHAELMQIVGLFVKRLGERMMDRDMSIGVSERAKEQLITLGWDPTMGARPLRRAVQQNVEDPLSERILQGELSPGQHVEVDFDGNEFTFATTKPASEPVAAGVGES
jgi:ATP-dependent Clp protease ATP-binding subunit ClpC